MTAPLVTHKNFDQILCELENTRNTEGDDVRYAYTYWLDTTRLQDMPAHRGEVIDATVAAEYCGCLITTFEEPAEDDGRMRSTSVTVTGTVANLIWFFHLVNAFRIRAHRR
jgi:hypothetical protein